MFILKCYTVYHRPLENSMVPSNVEVTVRQGEILAKGNISSAGIRETFIDAANFELGLGDRVGCEETE